MGMARGATGCKTREPGPAQAQELPSECTKRERESLPRRRTKAMPIVHNNKTPPPRPSVNSCPAMTTRVLCTEYMDSRPDAQRGEQHGSSGNVGERRASRHASSEAVLHDVNGRPQQARAPPAQAHANHLHKQPGQWSPCADENEDLRYSRHSTRHIHVQGSVQLRVLYCDNSLTRCWPTRGSHDAAKRRLHDRDRSKPAAE